MRRAHLVPPALVATIVAAAIPTPARRPARLLLGVYAAALGLAGGRGARRGPTAEARLLPAVLATMHVAWGLGFIAGLARFAPGRRAGARPAPPARP
jgi:succinoglycan biosynthesis protein ExoA